MVLDFGYKDSNAIIFPFPNYNAIQGIKVKSKYKERQSKYPSKDLLQNSIYNHAPR